MAKAIQYGLAAALALTVSLPAWAEYVTEDSYTRSELTHLISMSDAKGNPIASESATASAHVKVNESATDSTAEAGGGSGEVMESEDANESSNERWLREREGYRDGGY